MIRLEIELHDEDDLIEFVNMVHGLVTNAVEALK